jgi:subtilisin-like proprotein convertase family protein
MKSKMSHRLARLASFLWHRPARRPLARHRARLTLECLEERALLSTLGVVNLDQGPGAAATTARSAAPSQTVFRATDVPQPVDFPDVFTTSSIDVGQNLTIASLKVQLNLTYPLDNDLTIDLIAPNGTDVSLSAFEGTGANFQGTIFDDAAATPIGAGNSPFAGSYRPESPLAALSGMNAQGTWQLQIVDWGGSAGTLNSWSLIVQPAGSLAPAANSLVVSTFPSSATAGAGSSFTVTARDANGNVATGYTGTVHFTSTDPQAQLPADYTFTAADAGVHTFSATLKTAGTQSLTATDLTAGGLTGIEAGIAVSPAAASRLAVSAPSAVTAGTAFNVTVTAQDAYGNTATGYAGTVHFTSSDGQAVLPVNSTLLNGTGSFSVTLKSAGSQTLTATGTAGGTLTGSAVVSVSPAVSGALAFHATDLPQTFNSFNVFVSSVINVPQGVTIGSLKVQVNVTYPRDSDLRIDLYHIDNNGFLRSFQVLSDFVGAGANFQNTIFDDAATTPIAAGVPPFAGSYRPSDPLSALVGQDAQGTWVLEVGDFVGGTGTLNSWSLIIQPAGSASAAAGRALVAAPSAPRVATDALPFALLPLGGNFGRTVGETAGMSDGFSPSDLVAGNSFMDALAAMRLRQVWAEPVLVPPDAGLHCSADVRVRDGVPGQRAGANILTDNEEFGGPANGVNDRVVW